MEAMEREAFEAGAMLAAIPTERQRSFTNYANAQKATWDTAWAACEKLYAAREKAARAEGFAEGVKSVTTPAGGAA